jgi:uncharacterized SAM-binding protein YcdF (DUF218 family)
LPHFLRGLVTVLVVPPPNLVLLAIAGFMLLHWTRYRRAGTILLATGLALLLILSVPVTGQALLVSLEQDLSLDPPKEAPPAAIVILSAEVEHAIGPGPDVRVGPLTLQRLRAGAELARRTHLPILVSGGTLQEDDPAMASIMADSLKDDFGIPAQWIEARSRNTWENASDSAAILLPKGIRSVYVVTHAWHEWRATIAFRHAGLIPTAAPVQLDDLSAGLLPEISGWSRSYYGLHEWIGLAVYWLDTYLRPSNRAL